MNDQQQFQVIVRAVPVMVIRPLELVNTILRTCDCLTDTLVPHYVLADGYQCSVCGKKS